MLDYQLLLVYQLHPSAHYSISIHWEFNGTTMVSTGDINENIMLGDAKVAALRDGLPSASSLSHSSNRQGGMS